MQGDSVKSLEQIGAALPARQDGLLPHASCHPDRTWPARGGRGGQVRVRFQCISWPQFGTLTPPLQVGFALAEPSCRPLDLKKCQRIHS